MPSLTSPSRKAVRRITTDEARRALYVDIEKLQDQPPSLVGIHCEGVYRPVSVDERLHAAARATGVECMTFPALANEVVRRAQDEDRLIVAFTRAELNWFEEYANVDLTPWYRDAHKIGKRWINREHPGVLQARRLQDFATFLDSPRPNRLRGGKATGWLRAAFRAQQVGYNGLHTSQQQRWRWVRDYNEWDCVETRELVLRASESGRSSNPITVTVDRLKLVASTTWHSGRSKAV